VDFRNDQDDVRVRREACRDIAFVINTNTDLIESLSDPAAFPHPVTSIEVIESHISWVILTGPFAYKIKKPVQLPFLDFRELDSRLYYCEEEIRLNRPWAPDIYLDVVPITVQAGRAQIGGFGQVVEYAVRMRQFDQDQRLDAQLDANKLSMEDMRELADTVASRHQSARRIGPGQLDEVVSLIRDAMWDNLDALQGRVASQLLRKLRQWTTAELHRLDGKLRQRFENGFVRECHGDLHLSNLVRLPTGITTFDCIEFSSEFRNIDVMCDTAFLVMDLVSRQRPDLAWQFLNRYLEITGDYDSMEVFNLYVVYRCLVRAKINAIRSLERKHKAHASTDRRRVRQCCELALKQTKQRAPDLVVMHGLSASGKTWLSTRLMSTLPAVRIRSDIERKRMFGLDEAADSDSGIAQGIYTASANDALYERMHEIAAAILKAGHNVILDAAYLEFSKRSQAREIAADCNARLRIVHAHAPVSVLRDRIRKRTKCEHEPSEAGLAVLNHQLANTEALTRNEKIDLVNWSSEDPAHSQPETEFRCQSD
jgi:aminoglycoside phosphotransferase family enzyme